MDQRWNLFQKIGFLFLAFYLFIYINSSQFFLTSFIEPLWQKFIPWFAKALGRPDEITVFTNGSGDTSYNYYQILAIAILALFLALIVSLIDLRRNNYRTLLGWITVLVRYYLAYQMINYGLSKLFYLQFGFPTPARLDQELGDFSPMGLLWNFMGYSKGYTMFTGALEFLGGILLLSRRTFILGALTTFGVMLNVMMLNYFYDVPVKLLSTHMVLMSLFLIMLDAKRLFSFFISNQKVEPYLFPDILPIKLRKAKMIIKWLAIIGCLGYMLYQMKGYLADYGPNAPKPLFYGKYAVESFERSAPAIYSDTLQYSEKPAWETFYQSWDGYAMVKTSDGEKLRFEFNPDTTSRIIELKSYKDTVFQKLNYEITDSSRIIIDGIYLGDTLNMLMKKDDQSERELVKRGFRWVNEYPHNR